MLLVVKRAVAGDGDVVIVADVDAEAVGVDVAVTPEEEGTEDGLGQDVENAVEDGLGVGGDDVAALAQAPGDRVEEPEEDGPHGASDVGAMHVGSEGACVLASDPGHLPRDEEESGAAEGEETPLLCG